MPDPACQSKSPRFETKVVRDGSATRTVRSVGPVRGGLGYRWLVTPEGLNHIHLGEAGWTIWEAIHAPFLFRINNIDKTQNYIKIAFFYFFFFFLFFFFFIFTSSQTVDRSKVHRAAVCIALWTPVGIWNIKFGMGMCRFGMKQR